MSGQQSDTAQTLPSKTKIFFEKLGRHAATISNAITIALGIPSLLTFAVSALTYRIALQEFIEKWLGPNKVSDAATFFPFGFVLASLASLRFYLSYKNYKRKYGEKEAVIAQKDAEIARYRKPETYFRLWAKQNTECDKQLFDKLFYDPIQRKAQVESLREVKELIERNIEKTIDIASHILSAFTEKNCNARFEVLAPNTVVRDHKDWYTLGKALWTDERSRAERKKIENRRTYLGDDSSYRQVIVDEAPYYVSDDLRAEGKNYENKRTGWETEFNAIIVMPVDRLRLVEGSYDITGILVIDNKEGGLNHPTCIHYVKEICHRLAIMHYRLTMIGSFESNINKELSDAP